MNVIVALVHWESWWVKVLSKEFKNEIFLLPVFWNLLQKNNTILKFEMISVIREIIEIS
jgi:hypothetical protein